MSLNPVALESVSTVDTLKSVAINTIQWIGEKVFVVKDAVLSVIAKIIEFSKPFFASLAEVLASIFASARELISANREFVFPAAVVGVGLASLAGFFLCKKNDEGEIV